MEKAKIADQQTSMVRSPRFASVTDVAGHPLSITAALLHFLRDERAQDLVEYALVAVLMALGSVVALKGLATNIGQAFINVQTALTSSA